MIQGKKKRMTLDEMSTKQLTRILDKEFSLFIRLYYSDEHGMVQCATTGRWFPWNKIDCGHYVSRNRYSVRWDIHNVGPQSVSSNRFKGGDQFLMRKWLVEKFGEKAVEAVEAKAQMQSGVDSYWLAFQIKEYRESIRKLRQEKKF
jgi:hypothetical protein